MRNSKVEDNYLEKRPKPADHLEWSADDEGKVTLEIQNKGVFNRLAQILLKKTKVSYIHLDEMGSFIWPLLDGQKTILELGEEVEKEFGEKAKPLYERLARFFQILESYGFVEWGE